MKRKLVAYFSPTGTTAKVAKLLAKAADADIYEIKPAVPYTAADLNWNDKRSRTSLEMNDHSSRPKLADTDANIENHDVIFIGFPIWWYIAPTIINSFLESYDFSGKKIVLFATSGGSGFGKAAANLKESVASDTEIIEGCILNSRPPEDELRAWVESF